MNDIKERVERAEKLIVEVKTSRVWAANTGSCADGSIGQLPEAVALDVIALAEELDLHRTVGANMGRAGVLVRELHGLFAPIDSNSLDEVRRSQLAQLEAGIDSLRVENAALVAKVGELSEKYRAALLQFEEDQGEIRRLSRELREATVCQDPPIEKTPEQLAPAALGGPPASAEPVAPKARAPEKEVSIATWELDGRDFAALAKQGFEREAIMLELPKFRAHHAAAKTMGKRPRVTLAGWMAGKSAT